MSTEQIKIVVVEDSEDHAELIKLSFTRYESEFSLICFNNLTNAKEFLGNNAIDFVIADIRLPDGSGTDLIAKDFGYGYFPVVIMTSFGDQTIAVDAMKSGALDYIVKSPESLSNMPHVTRRCLREWEVLTEKKNLESKLRSNVAFLESLLSAIPSPVYFKDVNGVYNECNQQFCETILGLPKEKIIGRIPSEFKDDYASKFDVDRRKILHKISLETTKTDKQLISTIGEITDEVSFPSHNSQDMRDYLRIRSTICDTDNNPAGVVCVMTDITENRKNEKRLHHSEKMSAIGQLAGGIAHDFNNQLAAIMGYANLLITLPEKDKALKFANMILKAAKTSSDLTSQLLSFARAGNFSVKPLDIHDVLHETLSLFERTINKRILVSTDFRSSSPQIIGDVSQLRNAFLNLCLNARDSIPESGTVKIFTENVTLDDNYCHNSPGSAKPGEFIKISVCDSGTGIPADHLPHIFEPFFTTKDEGKGTGMGLASVYGAVTGHKGTIECISTLGRGTVFEVFLPLTNEDVAKNDEDNSVTKATKTGRILVVEDEEIVREMTTDILDKLGHESTTATSGIQAIELIKEKPGFYDIVLLDMIMPKMSGTETFYEIKKIAPDLKTVIISGFSQHGEAKQLIDDGASGFIQKPFNLLEFSEIISDLLDSK